MLFPVVIVIVLFVAGNYAVGYLGDGLSGVIEAKMTEWIEGISWLEWVSGVAGFLVKLLTRFLYYILFISFGGYVVMVVMSRLFMSTIRVPCGMDAGSVKDTSTA